MYCALDAGHGQSSRTAGVYDPGASLQGYQEHKLAQELVDNLDADLRALGHRTHLPTGIFTSRDDAALRASVDFYLSVHFNGGLGTGTEAFVNTTSATYLAKVFATDISGRLAKVMGIPNRGMKYANFAVLSANRNDALIEVCFPADVQKYIASKDKVELAILNALLKAHGLTEVPLLPRKETIMPEVPYWIVVSLFKTPADAESYVQWCRAEYIAAKPSGVAVIIHGNDVKSRAAEAEAERRGAVCPFGRVRTIKTSYTLFSSRTPYLPGAGQ